MTLGKAERPAGPSSALPIDGKQAKPLGAYPSVTLAEARSKAADMRKLLAQDIDPLTEKARTSSESNQAFEVATKAFLDHVLRRRPIPSFPHARRNAGAI